ncbi:MAG: hypothetical protein ACPG5V_14630 [Vibrio cyclitrophicus]
MSEAKFTKGEWIVYVESDDFGRQSYDEIVIGMASYNDDPYGHYCMHKVVIEDEETSEEALANAHLIAAAPDIYEYLEGLYQNLCSIGDDSETVDEIKTLLAKARGEK